MTIGIFLSFSPKCTRIKLQQRWFLENNYVDNVKKLVIFMSPGIDTVNGGILSICSLYEETRKLSVMANVETVLCEYPGDPPLLRYTKFRNNNVLLNFSDVLKFFSPDDLLIHIPEHFAFRFLCSISPADRKKIRGIPHFSINILLQNIEYLPSKRVLNGLGRIGKLTATTAHEKYCTLQLRKELGFPLHKLSTYVSSDKYCYRQFADKDDLMILSPDPHFRRTEVIDALRTMFPKLQIQVIQNLTYERYKQVIAKAKWALTFGEGLDGYFVESIFSGAISFSVYRPEFFPKKFESLRTVYPSYDALIKNICNDIIDFDIENNYSAYQLKQFQLCDEMYSHNSYIRNLELFYKKFYTYP